MDAHAAARGRARSCYGRGGLTCLAAGGAHAVGRVTERRCDEAALCEFRVVASPARSAWRIRATARGTGRRRRVRPKARARPRVAPPSTPACSRRRFTRAPPRTGARAPSPPTAPKSASRGLRPSRRSTTASSRSDPRRRRTRSAARPSASGTCSRTTPRPYRTRSARRPASSRRPTRPPPRPAPRGRCNLCARLPWPRWSRSSETIGRWTARRRPSPLRSAARPRCRPTSSTPTRCATS